LCFTFLFDGKKDYAREKKSIKNSTYQSHRQIEYHKQNIVFIETNRGHMFINLLSYTVFLYRDMNLFISAKNKPEIFVFINRLNSIFLFDHDRFSIVFYMSVIHRQYHYQKVSYKCRYL
jgi:hypothetical protein